MPIYLFESFIGRKEELIGRNANDFSIFLGSVEQDERPTSAKPKSHQPWISGGRKALFLPVLCIPQSGDRSKFRPWVTSQRMEEVIVDALTSNVCQLQSQ